MNYLNIQFLVTTVLIEFALRPVLFAEKCRDLTSSDALSTFLISCWSFKGVHRLHTFNIFLHCQHAQYIFGCPSDGLSKTSSPPQLGRLLVRRSRFNRYFFTVFGLYFEVCPSVGHTFSKYVFTATLWSYHVSNRWTCGFQKLLH